MLLEDIFGVRATDPSLAIDSYKKSATKPSSSSSSPLPASWGPDTVKISPEALQAALLADRQEEEEALRAAEEQKILEKALEKKDQDAKALAEQSAGKNTESGAVDEGAENNAKTEHEANTESFQAYLDRARSKTEGSSSEDRIGALKEKLQKLQGQLATTAGSEKISGEVKSSRMKTLETQIDQVTAELAELMAEAQMQESAGKKA